MHHGRTDAMDGEEGRAACVTPMLYGSGRYQPVFRWTQTMHIVTPMLNSVVHAFYFLFCVPTAEYVWPQCKTVMCCLALLLLKCQMHQVPRRCL
jgi:hypothetical protein